MLEFVHNWHPSSLFGSQCILELTQAEIKNIIIKYQVNISYLNVWQWKFSIISIYFSVNFFIHIQLF